MRGRLQPATRLSLRRTYARQAYCCSLLRGAQHIRRLPAAGAGTGEGRGPQPWDWWRRDRFAAGVVLSRQAAVHGSNGGACPRLDTRHPRRLNDYGVSISVV